MCTGAQMIGNDRNHDKREKRIFKISSICTAGYSLIALIAALITKSLTLGIDSSYAVLDLALLIPSIILLNKLKLSSTKTYNFGYFKLEPLIVVLRGLLILSICITGIVTSVQQLIYPVITVQNYSVAIGFGTFSFLFASALWFWLKRENKKIRSQLIDANAIGCKVEAIISFGMVIGFPLGFWLSKYNIGFSLYIDPLMAICLSLYLITHPVEILKDSFKDLLDISPGQEKESAISNVVDNFLQTSYQMNGNSKIKLRRAGRKYFATISYEVMSNMTFEAVQNINRAINSHLEKSFPDLHATYVPSSGNSEPFF